MKMLIIIKIKKLMSKHFVDLKWYNIGFMVLLYLAVSWSALWLCGEHDLTRGVDFLYWSVVTAATVGYGDLSPVTAGGKLVTSLYIIPVGLALFGLILGRLAAYVSFQWRRGVQGLKSLHCSNHVLVIGWRDDRTQSLLELLMYEMRQHSDTRDIALCVRREMDNPMPDDIHFVRVSQFTNDEEMEKACVAEASCIIVDCDEDDVTASTVLYVASVNSGAHIITSLNNDYTGRLLKNHFPNVEAMPSVMTEMLAKSAMDPGSSAIVQELLNAERGMTEYTIKYEGVDEVSLESLFTSFKQHHDATIIGLATSPAEAISVNPSFDEQVSPGAILYYIARQRIRNADWSRLATGGG